MFVSTLLGGTRAADKLREGCPVEKSRLTRILALGEPTLLADLARTIESQAAVEVIAAPRLSVTMARIIDPVTKTPFYLGEVLISECTVSVRGALGFGAIMGESLQRAYELAVVDAAWDAAWPQNAEWRSRLLAQEAEIQRCHEREFAQMAASRVDFATKGEFDRR